jgi:DNA polymerase-3 subunit alpha
LIELAREYGIKLVCTNDVHFVEQENAEAHDHLLCLSTGKDLDDPTRMLYSKQEWFKTKAEMNDIFSDVPEALSNTLEILDKVEIYSLDHDPIMPFSPFQSRSVQRMSGERSSQRLTFIRSLLVMRMVRINYHLRRERKKSRNWVATTRFTVLSLRQTIWLC